jgi:hypothetical protein
MVQWEYSQWGEYQNQPLDSFCATWVGDGGGRGSFSLFSFLGGWICTRLSQTGTRPLAVTRSFQPWVKSPSIWHQHLYAYSTWQTRYDPKSDNLLVCVMIQSNLVKRERVKRDFCSKRDTVFCLLNPISIQITMVNRDFALSGTV